MQNTEQHIRVIEGLLKAGDWGEQTPADAMAESGLLHEIVFSNALTRRIRDQGAVFFYALRHHLHGHSCSFHLNAQGSAFLCDEEMQNARLLCILL